MFGFKRSSSAHPTRLAPCLEGSESLNPGRWRCRKPRGRDGCRSAVGAVLQPTVWLLTLQSINPLDLPLSCITRHLAKATSISLSCLSWHASPRKLLDCAPVRDNYALVAHSLPSEMRCQCQHMPAAQQLEDLMILNDLMIQKIQKI